MSKSHGHKCNEGAAPPIIIPDDDDEDDLVQASNYTLLADRDRTPTDIDTIDSIDLDKLDTLQESIRDLCDRFKCDANNSASTDRASRFNQHELLRLLDVTYIQTKMIKNKQLWQVILDEYSDLSCTFPELRHDIKYLYRAINLLAYYINYQCDKFNQFPLQKGKTNVYECCDQICQLMSVILYGSIDHNIMVLLKTDLLPKNAYLLIVLCNRINEQIKRTVLTDTIPRIQRSSVVLINVCLLLYNLWRQLIPSQELPNFDRAISPVLQRLDQMRSRIRPDRCPEIQNLYMRFKSSFKTDPVSRIVGDPVHRNVIDKFFRAYIDYSAIINQQSLRRHVAAKLIITDEVIEIEDTEPAVLQSTTLQSKTLQSTTSVTTIIPQPVLLQTTVQSTVETSHKNEVNLNTILDEHYNTRSQPTKQAGDSAGKVRSQIIESSPIYAITPFVENNYTPITIDLIEDDPSDCNIEMIPQKPTCFVKPFVSNSELVQGEDNTKIGIAKIIVKNIRDEVVAPYENNSLLDMPENSKHPVGVSDVSTSSDLIKNNLPQLFDVVPRPSNYHVADISHITAENEKLQGHLTVTSSDSNLISKSKSYPHFNLNSNPPISSIPNSSSNKTIVVNGLNDTRESVMFSCKLRNRTFSEVSTQIVSSGLKFHKCKEVSSFTGESDAAMPKSNCDEKLYKNEIEADKVASIRQSDSDKTVSLSSDTNLSISNEASMPSFETDKIFPKPINNEQLYPTPLKQTVINPHLLSNIIVPSVDAASLQSNSHPSTSSQTALRQPASLQSLSLSKLSKQNISKQDHKNSTQELFKLMQKTTKEKSKTLENPALTNSNDDKHNQLFSLTNKDILEPITNVSSNNIFRHNKLISISLSNPLLNCSNNISNSKSNIVNVGVSSDTCISSNDKTVLTNYLSKDEEPILGISNMKQNFSNALKSQSDITQSPSYMVPSKFSKTKFDTNDQHVVSQNESDVKQLVSSIDEQSQIEIRIEKELNQNKCGMKSKFGIWQPATTFQNLTDESSLSPKKINISKSIVLVSDVMNKTDASENNIFISPKTVTATPSNKPYKVAKSIFARRIKPMIHATKILNPRNRNLTRKRKVKLTNYQSNKSVSSLTTRVQNDMVTSTTVDATQSSDSVPSNLSSNTLSTIVEPDSSMNSHTGDDLDLDDTTGMDTLRVSISEEAIDDNSHMLTENVSIQNAVTQKSIAINHISAYHDYAVEKSKSAEEVRISLKRSKDIRDLVYDHITSDEDWSGVEDEHPKLNNNALLQQSFDTGGRGTPLVDETDYNEMPYTPEPMILSPDRTVYGKIRTDNGEISNDKQKIALLPTPKESITPVVYGCSSERKSSPQYDASRHADWHDQQNQYRHMLRSQDRESRSSGLRCRSPDVNFRSSDREHISGLCSRSSNLIHRSHDRKDRSFLLCNRSPIENVRSSHSEIGNIHIRLSDPYIRLGDIRYNRSSDLRCNRSPDLNTKSPDRHIRSPSLRVISPNLCVRSSDLRSSRSPVRRCRSPFLPSESTVRHSRSLFRRNRNRSSDRRRRSRSTISSDTSRQRDNLIKRSSRLVSSERQSKNKYTTRLRSDSSHSHVASRRSPASNRYIRRHEQRHTCPRKRRREREKLAASLHLGEAPKHVNHDDFHQTSTTDEDISDDNGTMQKNCHGRHSLHHSESKTKIQSELQDGDEVTVSTAQNHQLAMLAMFSQLQLQDQSSIFFRSQNQSFNKVESIPFNTIKSIESKKTEVVDDIFTCNKTTLERSKTKMMENLPKEPIISNRTAMREHIASKKTGEILPQVSLRSISSDLNNDNSTNLSEMAGFRFSEIPETLSKVSIFTPKLLTNSEIEVEDCFQNGANKMANNTQPQLNKNYKSKEVSEIAEMTPLAVSNSIFFQNSEILTKTNPGNLSINTKTLTTKSMVDSSKSANADNYCGQFFQPKEYVEEGNITKFSPNDIQPSKKNHTNDDTQKSCDDIELANCNNFIRITKNRIKILQNENIVPNLCVDLGESVRKEINRSSIVGISGSITEIVSEKQTDCNIELNEPMSDKITAKNVESPTGSILVEHTKRISNENIEIFLDTIIYETDSDNQYPKESNDPDADKQNKTDSDKHTKKELDIETMLNIDKLIETDLDENPKVLSVGIIKQKSLLDTEILENVLVKNTETNSVEDTEIGNKQVIKTFSVENTATFNADSVETENKNCSNQSDLESMLLHSHSECYALFKEVSKPISEVPDVLLDDNKFINNDLHSKQQKEEELDSVESIQNDIEGKLKDKITEEQVEVLSEKFVNKFAKEETLDKVSKELQKETLQSKINFETNEILTRGHATLTPLIVANDDPKHNLRSKTLQLHNKNTFRSCSSSAYLAAYVKDEPTDEKPHLSEILPIKRQRRFELPPRRQSLSRSVKPITYTQNNRSKPPTKALPKTTPVTVRLKQLNLNDPGIFMVKLREPSDSNTLKPIPVLMSSIKIEFDSAYESCNSTDNTNSPHVSISPHASHLPNTTMKSDLTAEHLGLDNHHINDNHLISESSPPLSDDEAYYQSVTLCLTDLKNQNILREAMSPKQQSRRSNDLTSKSSETTIQTASSPLLVPLDSIATPLSEDILNSANSSETSVALSGALHNNTTFAPSILITDSTNVHVDDKLLSHFTCSKTAGPTTFKPSVKDIAATEPTLDHTVSILPSLSTVDNLFELSQTNLLDLNATSLPTDILDPTPPRSHSSYQASTINKKNLSPTSNRKDGPPNKKMKPDHWNYEIKLFECFFNRLKNSSNDTSFNIAQHELHSDLPRQPLISVRHALHRLQIYFLRRTVSWFQKFKFSLTLVETMKKMMKLDENPNIERMNALELKYGELKQLYKNSLSLGELLVSDQATLEHVFQQTDDFLVKWNEVKLSIFPMYKIQPHETTVPTYESTQMMPPSNWHNETKLFESCYNRLRDSPNDDPIKITQKWLPANLPRIEEGLILHGMLVLQASFLLLSISWFRKFKFSLSVVEFMEKTLQHFSNHNGQLDYNQMAPMERKYIELKRSYRNSVANDKITRDVQTTLNRVITQTDSFLKLWRKVMSSAIPAYKLKLPKAMTVAAVKSSRTSTLPKPLIQVSKPPPLLPRPIVTTSHPVLTSRYNVATQHSAATTSRPLRISHSPQHFVRKLQSSRRLPTISPSVVRSYNSVGTTPNSVVSIPLHNVMTTSSCMITTCSIVTTSNSVATSHSVITTPVKTNKPVLVVKSFTELTETVVVDNTDQLLTQSKYTSEFETIRESPCVSGDSFEQTNPPEFEQIPDNPGDSTDNFQPSFTKSDEFMSNWSSEPINSSPLMGNDALLNYVACVDMDVQPDPTPRNSCTNDSMISGGQPVTRTNQSNIETNQQLAAGFTVDNVPPDHLLNNHEISRIPMNISNSQFPDLLPNFDIHNDDWMMYLDVEDGKDSVVNKISTNAQSENEIPK